MARSLNHKWILVGLGTLTGLVSPCAMAGTGGGGVIIGFGASATSVPLDHWTSVVAFGMITVAAYFLLRRQSKFGRFSLWAMLAMLAGIGAYGLRDYDWLSTAQATIAVVEVSLSASPTAINLQTTYGCRATAHVTNQTGRPVSITSITWVLPCGEAVVPPVQTPQCTLGLPLAIGADCYLESRLHAS
jgi:hypothetical protein